jgi:hypothetical protein
MRALGNYMMRGSVHAVGVAGTLTVVSWFFVPFTYLLSGTPVGLVALRRGPVAGMQVIAGTFLFVALVAWVAGMGPGIAASYAVGIWLPVWLVSFVLRRTESQAALLLAAAVLAILFALSMHVAVGDAGAFWRSNFEAWFGSQLPAQSAETYREFFRSAEPLFNGIVAAALFTSVVAAVLAARWWQALLFNPGGFRAEFHAIRLPRGLCLVPAAAMGGWLLSEGALKAVCLDVLVVTLFVYLFQGLATVHRMVAARGSSPAWLVAMYAFLLLAPQVALFVACLGLADSWLGGGVGRGRRAE